MASEPVTMSQSYDDRIMNSWLGLMSSMTTAIGNMGAFPMPEFFSYSTYHGTEAHITTKDIAAELFSTDVNTGMGAHWDNAFNHTNTPVMLGKEQELYDDFRRQNELDPDAIGDAVGAFVDQQTAVVEQKLLPQLSLKFIANNCVFSSLYVLAQADITRQITADANKLGADLTVANMDKAANRSSDLLKALTATHAGFLVSRGDVAVRRSQVALSFALDKAKIASQGNLNASADRFNLIKAMYQINLDAHRWPGDNLKYLIAAQSAMQGIHTLQQSQSGAEALSGFARVAYDASSMVSLGASVGNLALGVHQAMK